MSRFWNITYVNTNLLAPGQFEAVQLPSKVAASGTQTVIKDGDTLYITDVFVRSVSTPLALDPSAYLVVSENNTPTELLLTSMSTSKGWHGSSPFVIEGDQSVSRGLGIVASSQAGISDRYIITLVGYIG